jgi:hypothetical protein
VRAGPVPRCSSSSAAVASDRTMPARWSRRSVEHGWTRSIALQIDAKGQRGCRRAQPEARNTGVTIRCRERFSLWHGCQWRLDKWCSCEKANEVAQRSPRHPPFATARPTGMWIVWVRMNRTGYTRGGCMGGSAGSVPCSRSVPLDVGCPVGAGSPVPSSIPLPVEAHQRQAHWRCVSKL